MTSTHGHRHRHAGQASQPEARTRKAAQTILLISAYALPRPRAPPDLRNPRTVTGDTATKHDAGGAIPTDHHVPEDAP
jgi:hypothetical protein